MRFKARIIDCVQNEVSGFYMEKEAFQTFEFSKNRIFFTKNQSTSSTYSLNFSSSFEINRIVRHCVIKNWIEYTLTKPENFNEKNQFRISFKDNIDNSECYSFLEINWWNRIKLNLIHKRYLVQREKDKIWLVVISAIIGYIIGTIGNASQYKLGYQNGLKDGVKDLIKQIQDTSVIEKKHR